MRPKPHQRLYRGAICAAIGISMGVAIPLAKAEVTAGSHSYCLRFLNLERNTTYTLAILASNEWDWWATSVVSFAGRVVTEDGKDTFADVWIVHTDLFRWGVNEDLGRARGPIFRVQERESFWGKGDAEVRVRTRDTATNVCMCTGRDASKRPSARCLTAIVAER